MGYLVKMARKVSKALKVIRVIKVRTALALVFSALTILRQN